MGNNHFKECIISIFIIMIHHYHNNVNFFNKIKLTGGLDFVEISKSTIWFDDSFMYGP